MSEIAIVGLIIIGAVPSIFMICFTVIACFALKHQPDIFDEEGDDDDDERSDNYKDV